MEQAWNSIQDLAPAAAAGVEVDEEVDAKVDIAAAVEVEPGVVTELSPGVSLVGSSY